MLAATLFKEFKWIFAGCRQATALASEFNRLPVELEGGAAPGWWTGSCFRSRPRSFNTSAGQDLRRVWFFVSAARGAVFASNSAMAVTHVARTARIDFEVMREALTNKLRLWASPMVLQP